MTESSTTTHSDEPHHAGLAGRLNWLRAAVLGANDGIVSTAGIVVGVAGATSSPGPIFTAGLAGLVAGAVSMALGEYVSVSSQRDSEKALSVKESRELRDMPEAELAELTAIYEGKGLSPETAAKVAAELTEHDALAAHLNAELNIDPEDLANPLQARRRLGRLVHHRRAPARAGNPAASGRLAGARDVRRGAGGARRGRCDQCAHRRQ